MVAGSPAMSTLHLGPVKKCILSGRNGEKRAEESRRRSVEQMKDIILIMGLEPAQVPLYCVCVCACGCMCDRWEDVKAPFAPYA